MLEADHIRENFFSFPQSLLGHAIACWLQCCFMLTNETAYSKLKKNLPLSCIFSQCLWLNSWGFCLLFIVTRSIATFMLLARFNAVGAQSALSKISVAREYLVWFCKELGLLWRIRNTDCNIANLVSVQTSRGSARMLGTRGDSCWFFFFFFFCAEHLVMHLLAGWKKAFPAPTTTFCFSSIHGSLHRLE